MNGECLAGDPAIEGCLVVCDVQIHPHRHPVGLAVAQGADRRQGLNQYP